MNAAFSRFLPVSILALGVLLISGMREQYVVPPVKPMGTLPSTILGIVGKDVVIGGEERRIAGMSDYAFREFAVDSGYLFSVYVGYYDRQVQGKTIHSPKNCLPGAGWEVMTSDRIATQSLTNQAGSMNRVLLANRGVRALVYYWYQGRGRIEASEYQVKWNLLRDAAMYGRTEEALVRIVLPLSAISPADTVAIAKSIAETDDIAMRVARELTATVNRVLPAAPGV
jgi:EpsI family protein